MTTSSGGQIPRGPSESLTKLEAARRQLRMAVRLFLEERDDVAIYTLACAAQDVLRGLLKARGVEKASFIKDTVRLKPEYYRQYLSLVNAPQNFLKHADRDPNATLEFHRDLVPFVLHDSLHMDARLTNRMLREGAAFMGWFTLEYPFLLEPGAFAETIARLAAEIPRDQNREAFRLLLERPDMWPDTD